MRLLHISVMGLAVCCAVGCQSGHRPASAQMAPPPRQAPPAPPRVETPIDPLLRTLADRELSESLRAADPIVRVHALEGMKEAHDLRHKAEILAALDDQEAVVRFAAAMAVGQLQIADAHDRLLAMAEDPSENVRVAVRFALHRLGDKRLSHQLEKLATDPNPMVRGNTAFVLGLLDEPSAVRVLRPMMDDTSAPVRQQAAESLWRLGDEEALKFLVGMTMSGHPDDQMIAYAALALPRKTIIRQHIRPGLVGEETTNPDREKWMLAVPLVAARAMGMLGSDEGYAVAQQGAKSVDPQLRMLAALAFGAIGRSDAQDILRKLLADTDPNVRIAAATAILQLKPPA